MKKPAFTVACFFFFASQIVFGQEAVLPKFVPQEAKTESNDDAKCEYMLIDKSDSYPVTVYGTTPPKIKTMLEYGDFDKLTAIPPGKWVSIINYGADKSQRLDDDEKGQVNLAPLDRFQDGELFMFSCGVSLHDADLIKLSRFESLQGLRFAVDDGFTDARVLKQFKDLERLTIYDIHQKFWKTKEAAATLGSMTKLRSLTLYGSFCDDDTMQIIGNLTNLESLWLPHMIHLSDRGLKSIQKITSLREMLFRNMLNGNPGITDEGLAGFAKLKNLEFLRMDVTNVSDEAVEALQAKFPNAKIKIHKWQKQESKPKNLNSPQKEKQKNSSPPTNSQ